MATGTLEIHGQNILPIIKRWLYSDKDIFLRELVSNACDAISKRNLLAQKGQATQQEPRIDIRIDTTARTLTIEDTGLGMDESELVRYLSQVAFSSAEEFLSHYEGASKDQIIGHFGLGFYSSFMVSSLVEVDSLSYKKESKGHKWSCQGGSEYQIDPSDKLTVGTKITLTIDQESSEYLESSKIEEMLTRYTRFLPYPIFLNDKAMKQPEPLWMRAPKDCTDEDYLAFYRELYPAKADPLFWIHLNVDHPFRLQGILYFPRKEDLRDATDAIQLYCNRVFVSEGCRDILPNYLLPLHGAIDSPDLPLNVSRSALQMDRSVRQLSSHISKKVADKLKEISENDRERFEKVWNDIEIIVKWGALQDDKFFERVEAVILWKNDQGKWIHLKDYLDRCESKHAKKIFYGLPQHLEAPCMRGYKQKGLEVIVANDLIDPPFFAHLEQKQGLHFQRIDSGLDEALVDSTKESTLLDENGQTHATRLAKLFTSLLDTPQELKLEAKSLADESLPLMITIDEQERRFHEYMARKGQHFPMTPSETLIVNSNNPLVQAIEKLAEKDQELAKQSTQRLVDLAKLSQQTALDDTARQHIVEKTWALMGDLIKKLI